MRASGTRGWKQRDVVKLMARCGIVSVNRLPQVTFFFQVTIILTLKPNPNPNTNPRSFPAFARRARDGRGNRSNFGRNVDAGATAGGGQTAVHRSSQCPRNDQGGTAVARRFEAWSLRTRRAQHGH